MADISKLNIDGTSYNIKDATARGRMVTYATSGTPAALGTASNGTETTVARSDHVHAKPTYGNITTAGAITATQEIADGDKLVIVDSSESSKLTGSTITFDGSTTNAFLSQKGTWETPTKPTYGNISTAGAISATATIANGDKLVIVDSSASSKLTGSSIKFDGSTTTAFLSKKGTWETPAGGTVPDGGKVGQILAKNSDADGDTGWYYVGNLPIYKWYLATGIVESQVIAAYQFIGAVSESVALININEGTQYPLSKSSTNIMWNTTYGIIFPAQTTYVDNATLRNTANTSAYSCVFGYKKLDTTKYPGGVFLSTKKGLFISAPNQAIKMSITNSSSVLTYAATSPESGVIGGVWDSTPKLYFNGAVQSLTTGAQCNFDASSYFVLGQAANNCSLFYCTCMAIYSAKLTASQQLELSNNITSLGGLS